MRPFQGQWIKAMHWAEASPAFFENLIKNSSCSPQRVPMCITAGDRIKSLEASCSPRRGLMYITAGDRREPADWEI